MLRPCFAKLLLAIVTTLWPMAAAPAPQATVDVPIVFSVGIVTQRGAPITVVGLRMPSLKARPPIVVFRNDTTKVIDRVYFTTGIARAGSLRTGEAEFAKSVRFVGGNPSGRLKLKPGELGEYKASPASNSYIPMVARLGANCLRAAHFVIKVRFSDGSVWEGSGPPGHVQDWLAMASEDAPLPCESAPDATEAMSNLNGSKFYGAGQPTHTEDRMVSHYQYQCSLHPKDELATCPF